MCVYDMGARTHIIHILCSCLRVSVVHVEVKKSLEKLVLTVYLCVGPGHQTQVSRLAQPAALSAEHLLSPVMLPLVTLGGEGRACAVGVCHAGQGTDIQCALFPQVSAQTRS